MERDVIDNAKRKVYLDAPTLKGSTTTVTKATTLTTKPIQSNSTSSTASKDTAPQLKPISAQSISTQSINTTQTPQLQANLIQQQSQNTNQTNEIYEKSMNLGGGIGSDYSETTEEEKSEETNEKKENMIKSNKKYYLTAIGITLGTMLAIAIYKSKNK